MPSLQIISQIKLNVSRPNSGVVVYAKQYDMASRIIDIDLVHGSAVWDPPSGSEMIAMCSKPDGTVCIYDIVEPYEQYSSEKTYAVGDKVIRNGYVYTCRVAINTPENWNSSHWTQNSAVTPAVTRTGTGKVRLILAEQALTCPGNVMVSVSFYQSNMRSTTLSFILNVEKSADDNDSMQSSDYFSVLSQLIEGLVGATTHPPQIDPNTKDWLTWDINEGGYVDSGFSSVGTRGPAPLITSQVRSYAVSNSGTTIPSSGWGTSVPTVDQGKWLWARLVVTYDSGDTVTSYSTAYQGVDGTTFVSSVDTYGVSATGTDMPSTWSATIPQVDPGKWLWVKTVVTYSGGESSTSYTKAYQGNDGSGSAGNNPPKGMSDTASVGSANAYSRQDHKHPYPITVADTVLTFPAYDAT